MIVVKVGGSLFDHPALGPGLRDFVASLSPAEVLLVGGGGPVADAVRELDRVHGLGEEAAHWVALRALGVTAAMLEHLIKDNLTPPAPFPKAEGGAREKTPLGERAANKARAVFSPSLFRGCVGCVWGVLGSSEKEGCIRRVGPRVTVLDCFAFALGDDSRPGALPHTWSVTTDSIAARTASVFDAEKLILLKSVDIPPGTSWAIAAANGWVDAHFPHIATTLACPIETINFRLWCQ